MSNKKLTPEQEEQLRNDLLEPDDDEISGDWNCPNCGREYDEVDYEYQICHYCKFNNNQNDK